MNPLAIPPSGMIGEPGAVYFNSPVVLTYTIWPPGTAAVCFCQSGVFGLNWLRQTRFPAPPIVVYEANHGNVGERTATIKVTGTVRRSFFPNKESSAIGIDELAIDKVPIEFCVWYNIIGRTACT